MPKKYWSWEQIPQVISTDEAARLLGIHVVNIRILCRDGKIPAAKVGREWRIDRDALRRYLNGGAA